MKHSCLLQLKHAPLWLLVPSWTQTLLSISSWELLLHVPEKHNKIIIMPAVVFANLTLILSYTLLRLTSRSWVWELSLTWPLCTEAYVALCRSEATLHV